MFCNADCLTNRISLTSCPIDYGRICSVIKGGGNPYKSWKGVVFNEVWKHVLYHHSAADRWAFHFFGF
jgi:hypothetical protein